MKTLREESSLLARELLATDRAFKYLDVPVLAKYDSRRKAWPGSHRNVTHWFELANGMAVGVNENMARGLSFPVARVRK